MKDQNITIIEKELFIFRNKGDRHEKVGSIKLSEKDINTEQNFIMALLKKIKTFDKGTYTIHYENGIFSRFDFENSEIKLHKWSENTGILMPCWNYFKE